MPIKRGENGQILINSTHPDYDAYTDSWDLIDRVLKGRDVQQYILELNPQDESDQNKTRNSQYKERAVFSRIAGRTVNRMIGLVFSKYPTLSIPTELDYIRNNIDGAGASIYQQSQATLKSVVSKGRAGLLVEYPIATEEISRADLIEKGYYATIQRFEPQQILNWTMLKRGADMALGQVVLKDIVIQNGETIGILRELSLQPVNENGEYVYVSRLWQYIDDEWKVVLESIPLDGYGMAWTEIPFMFVGSETNQPRVDDPPVYDLCRGNICHYRLHADYMDSVHFVGQPQGYVSGIEDVKGFVDEMKKDGWYSGSRKFAILPQGGNLAFASVPPNTMVKEAMDSMRDTLMGMGAFYITPGNAVKTATQAEGEQEEQHSILSLAASDVSEAYTKCLMWMCRYMKIDTIGEDDTPIYDLRRDFIRATAEPQLIQTLWQITMQGGIPKSDFWQNMRKLEIIDGEKSDEDIKDELESDNIGANGGALNLGDEADDDEAKLAAFEAAHPELLSGDIAGS